MYSRPLKKSTANESVLRPWVAESTARRISRIPTGNQVGSRAIDNQQRQQQLRRAPPPSDNLDESDPRFGTLYAIDQPSFRSIKNEAWNHVVMKTTESSLSSSSLMDTEQQQQRKQQQEAELKVKEIYSRTISKVEEEAKEMYNNVVLSDSEFRWMMIEDGCFFLQLALLILGCSKQLGYSDNNPIFGNNNHNKELKKHINAMFYPGNQIPLVVLRELMSQDFFRGVIEQRKWDKVPQTLCEKVLYEVLVLPVLDKNHPLMHRDILHALHSLDIGPDPLSRGRMPSYDDHIDLEKANKEEIETEDDSDDDGDDKDYCDHGRTSALRISDRKRVFRSARVHYKEIISLVAFFMFVRMFFTLLAYFRPPKP